MATPTVLDAPKPAEAAKATTAICFTRDDGIRECSIADARLEHVRITFESGTFFHAEEERIRCIVELLAWNMYPFEWRLKQEGGELLLHPAGLYICAKRISDFDDVATIIEEDHLRQCAHDEVIPARSCNHGVGEPTGCYNGLCHNRHFNSCNGGCNH